MLLGKPILAGESDKHQLDIIFDLVGSPTEQTMPGWKQLPGAEAISPRPRPPSLPQRFRDHGTSAISLLKELLTLDWRKRINAIDALEHPYFKSHPYPARPDDIPRFEDSHELDRRKFHDRKAALPPAPKGGTVGVGGGFDGSNAGFGSGGDGYGNRMNGGRYPPHHGGHRNGDDGRRPAWVRDQPRIEHRLPPRPPPPEHPPNGWDGPMDYRERDRPPPRNRGGGGGGANRPDIDTYIPSYRGGRDDRPPREDRLPPPPRDERLPPRDDRLLPRDDRLLPRDDRLLPRDDRLPLRDDRPLEGRRRWDERDDRRYEWDRRDREYDDRSRTSKTRSRSRSPLRDRERELYRR